MSLIKPLAIRLSQQTALHSHPAKSPKNGDINRWLTPVKSLVMPRYAAYKPSGVEWLGEVPEHWALRSLRYAATIQNGSDFKEYEVEEGGYPVLGSGGEFARISKFIYDQPSVLLGRKGTIDNPLYIEEPFWTVDTLFYTKIANDTHPRFFYWFCTSIPFGYFQYGSAVPSMTQNDLYGIKVPTPALEEQQTIADFLDAQTAKIDTLLAKKRQFIAKLKEKRSALIARTVTCGLPPAAAQAAGLEPHPAMKDSGVEWLGDVPAHWRVTRLGFLCSKIGSGKTPHGGADVYVDEGIMFLRSQNVYDEGLMLDDVVYIAEEIDNEMQGTRVKPRDILLNVTGASLGRTCIVPSEFVNANVNQHVCIIRLADLNLGTFIAWVIKAPFIKAQIEAIQSGAAREGLNFDQIAKLVLTLPPLEEQQAIAAYLERETARIDRLSALVEAALSRLTEYRQALITAAVTGKIDVREIAP